MREDVARLMNAKTYRIFSTISGATNKCLDIGNASQTPNAPLILYENNRKENQEFYLCPKGNYYAIVAAHSLLVLDVVKAVASNGTPVIQYPFYGTDNQLWKVKEIKKGVYIICSKLNERLVLDIAHANKANGTPIIIYQYNNTANQKFQLKEITKKKK